MAKNKGWIKVHRQIWDSDIWQSSEPFDARSAWLDLLLMANHEDAVIMIGGKPVTLKKGQMHTSINKLAVRWHWNPKKVRRFLGRAKGLSMVSTDGSAIGTTITIENYSIYNGYVDNETGNDRDNGRDNDRDNRTGITKKEKKEKKEKKDNKTIKSVLELAPPEMVPALRDFVEMRQTIKAPLTARALELLIGKVNKLSGGDIAKSIEILNQSTENGWKGVYEIKTSSEKPLNNYDKLAEWARGGD